MCGQDATSNSKKKIKKIAIRTRLALYCIKNMIRTFFPNCCVLFKWETFSWPQILLHFWRDDDNCLAKKLYSNLIYNVLIALLSASLGRCNICMWELEGVCGEYCKLIWCNVYSIHVKLFLCIYLQCLSLFFSSWPKHRTWKCEDSWFNWLKQFVSWHLFGVLKSWIKKFSNDG